MILHLLYLPLKVCLIKQYLLHVFLMLTMTIYQVEINNMKIAHIRDGVALTKFIYWIKKINKNKISTIEL